MTWPLRSHIWHWLLRELFLFTLSRTGGRFLEPVDLPCFLAVLFLVGSPFHSPQLMISTFAFPLHISTLSSDLLSIYRWPDLYLWENRQHDFWGPKIGCVLSSEMPFFSLLLLSTVSKQTCLYPFPLVRLPRILVPPNLELPDEKQGTQLNWNFR